MKVAITGGTGLIGQELTKLLIRKGHQVIILTRNADHQSSGNEQVRFVEWLKTNSAPEKELEGLDAFINLAGENLSNGRWTDEKKELIRSSRINATNEAVRIVSELKKKPSVFINGSAVGFYGTSFTKTFTEETKESADDFLASVVSDWEEAALPVEKSSRLIFARFGIVFDAEEGALQKMLLPFKLFAGGKIGTGEQWMSWIHLEDTARAFLHCIEDETITGPVNFTAPNPEKNKDVAKKIGEVLNKPATLPAPSIFLKSALGEMSILVLEGQQILPIKLLDHNFAFNYPDLNEALRDLLKEIN